MATPPVDEDDSCGLRLAAAWQVLNEVAYELGTYALSLPEGDTRTKAIEAALRVKEQSDIIYDLRAPPPRGLQHWIQALIRLTEFKNHIPINSEKHLDEMFCAVYDVHHRRCLWWREVENALGMSAYKFAETRYRTEGGKPSYPVSFPTLENWLHQRDYNLSPEKRKHIKDALRQHLQPEHHHLIDHMPE
jgi:hypothetical protein